MSEYYTEDCDKLPFATSVELYQQQLPRWLAVYLAAWLRFRAFIGMPPRPESASRWSPDFEWQTRDEMPAKALSRWAPHLERLQDCGFNICGWSRSDTIGAKEEANAFLLDESGTTLATILWIRMAAKHCIEQTQVSFTSYKNDGGEIVTMALPDDQQLLTGAVVPDYADLLSLAKSTSVVKVYRTHCERPGVADSIAFSSEGVCKHFRQQRIRLFEHSCNIGLIRTLSLREVEYAKRLSVARS
jgi:hypothetical protein